MPDTNVKLAVHLSPEQRRELETICSKQSVAAAKVRRARVLLLSDVEHQDGRRRDWEIAEIVGQHVRLKNYRPDGAICEKEIVYYADKRVNHDEVVSLDERLKYILDRYGQNNATFHQRIKDNFHMCKNVEHKLFATLSFNPEDINQMVK